MPRRPLAPSETVSVLAAARWVQTGTFAICVVRGAEQSQFLVSMCVVTRAVSLVQHGMHTCIAKIVHTLRSPAAGIKTASVFH